MLGLTVPVFIGNPVIIMIASQAVSPVLMPLLIFFVFLMINNRKIVGDYRHPLWLNVGLLLTFLFSLFMAYTAITGFYSMLTG